MLLNLLISLEVDIFTVITQSADPLLDYTSRLSNLSFCTVGGLFRRVSRKFLRNVLKLASLLSVETFGENIPESSSSHCE